MASPPQAIPSGPDDDIAPLASRESEPLLGRPGDATQRPGDSMIRNLWLGTGWLALLGVVVLLLNIWTPVFTHPILGLVSPHPILQSLGLGTLVLAVLVLQPTGATPESKVLGQRAHAALQFTSLLLLASGVAVIETNKSVNNGEHFHSAHGYLGVITGVLLAGQYVVGFAMWALPGLFGGEARAKAVWKYHRYGGYVLLVVLLATVVSAAETDYAKKVLGVKTWAVAIGAALVVVGVYPRIQMRKLGIQRGD